MLLYKSPKAPCSCGAPSSYADCCLKVHQDHSAALIPEQLMRARYTAYVLSRLRFVLLSWHPSTRPSKVRPFRCDWLGLEIFEAPLPAQDALEGFVTFKAHMKSPGQDSSFLFEKSRFIKEEGLWYYLDGLHDP